jgi:hypothetical protein
MEEVVYEALCRYFNTLERTGYLANSEVEKLLVLTFFKDFVTTDYRGLITYEDYRVIEQALNCLFGSTCLIPYPDYLKMGKLHLGDMTELACRVKKIEEEKVVKVIHDTTVFTDDSDVIITADEET